MLRWGWCGRGMGKMKNVYENFSQKNWKERTTCDLGIDGGTTVRWILNRVWGSELDSAGSGRTFFHAVCFVLQCHSYPVQLNNLSSMFVWSHRTQVSRSTHASCCVKWTECDGQLECTAGYQKDTWVAYECSSQQPSLWGLRVKTTVAWSRHLHPVCSVFTVPTSRNEFPWCLSGNVLTMGCYPYMNEHICSVHYMCFIFCYDWIFLGSCISFTAGGMLHYHAWLGRLCRPPCPQSATGSACHVLVTRATHWKLIVV
jgi:hypothetical protein